MDLILRTLGWIYSILAGVALVFGAVACLLAGSWFMAWIMG